MAKKQIPEEIRKSSEKEISSFNSKNFKNKEGIKYYATFKNNFLFLNRIENGIDGPIARLEFNGQPTNWEFAIFKWSTEEYDPEDFSFPGSENLDGTITGALKACNKAYPPSWSPSAKDFNTIMNLFFKK